MRITDPQVIQDGEQDLIASVQKDLDLEAVKDLLKERLNASALSPKGGRIVVHDNDVAFRLDYEINLNGSLLFDRDGNLIEDSQSEISIPDAQSDSQDEILGEEDAMLASDEDEDLSSDSPDYDEAAAGEFEESQTEELETTELPDEIQDADPGLEIDDLEEDDVLFDQDESDSAEEEEIDELIGELTKDDDKNNDAEDLTGDEPTDLDLKDGGMESGENGDDDMSDLLQENREFWEKKKE
jgi:hypothetical protein